MTTKNTWDKKLADGTDNPDYVEGSVNPAAKKDGETEEQRIERLALERAEAIAAEKLKDVKTKLDNAYAQRDEALRIKAELEAKEKEAQRKQLEEQGKYKELYELQLAESEKKAAEERAAREAAEKRNTELTRDVSVREAISGLNFRNERAATIATKEITAELIKNDAGVWIHKSGISIKDFIVLFEKDEANAFLFKAKSSSGAGTGAPAGQADTNAGKSLFQLPQAEVLKRAAEGKLNHQSR